MASKRKDIQSGGIRFGERWKLVPLDGLNWELCHLHVTRETGWSVKAGTAGKERWNRLGKFYQHDTFGNALRFAADFELKEGCEDEAIPIADALDRYERVAQEFTEGIRDALLAS